jgi:hypothetical protein
MPELWFAASADRLLYELEADETRGRLFERINAVLSDLEVDSNQLHLRRHRFQIGMWGVIVASGADEWIVIWEPHPDIDDAIIIQYVGSSAF